MYGKILFTSLFILAIFTSCRNKTEVTILGPRTDRVVEKNVIKKYKHPVKTLIFLTEGMDGSDYLAFYDVFRTSGDFADHGMEVLTAAQTRDAVTTAEGLRITPDKRLREVKDIDVLVLPGREGAGFSESADSSLVLRLAELAGKAEYIVCSGNGSLLAASLGAPEGAHLALSQDLSGVAAGTYPDIRWEHGSPIVHSGKILSSFGGKYAWESSLYLTSILFGPAVAADIADALHLAWSEEESAVVRR